MASSVSASSTLLLPHHHHLSLRPQAQIHLPFPSIPPPISFITLHVLRGGKVRSHGTPAQDPALLRRPLVSSPSSEDGDDSPVSDEVPVEERAVGDGKQSGKRRKGDEDWVDWEDAILQDTVPLVGFVRMILHSGKYECGVRLSPEHEKTILERLLPYHPEFEKKIGCGIDFITIGFHPEFENSRCLFIVRKDGELIDFSYWKCIKGLIRKNYPLYADSFILRHFRRRRNND
ncbi:protein DCL, chloroplastic-like [Typha angustifolia]|uniref:protein DCL, chloroplastic-like n=1 Tax=Typha angustifolia TaxID=59011 RepID=UPI003C30928A